MIGKWNEWLSKCGQTQLRGQKEGGMEGKGNVEGLWLNATSVISQPYGGGMNE